MFSKQDKEAALFALVLFGIFAIVGFGVYKFQFAPSGEMMKAEIQSQSWERNIEIQKVKKVNDDLKWRHYTTLTTSGDKSESIYDHADASNYSESAFKYLGSKRKKPAHDTYYAIIDTGIDSGKIQCDTYSMDYSDWSKYNTGDQLNIRVSRSGHVTVYDEVN